MSAQTAQVKGAWMLKTRAILDLMRLNFLSVGHRRGRRHMNSNAVMLESLLAFKRTRADGVLTSLRWMQPGCSKNNSCLRMMDAG